MPTGNKDDPHLWGGNIWHIWNGKECKDELYRQFGVREYLSLNWDTDGRKWAQYLANRFNKHILYIGSGIRDLISPAGFMGTNIVGSTKETSWLPPVSVDRKTRRWSKGQSSKEKPFTVTEFTQSSMSSLDHTAWQRRGERLEDLIVLAKEYGQFFKWGDGRIFPTSHSAGDADLLLLCTKRSQYNMKRSIT